MNARRKFDGWLFFHRIYSLYLELLTPKNTQNYGTRQFNQFKLFR